MDALFLCENDKWPTLQRIVDTNGFYSYGPGMFQQSTWLHYGKAFGTTKENIYDEELQEIVAIHMLNNGGAGHWYTCANKVKAILGPYPIPGGTSV